MFDEREPRSSFPEYVVQAAADMAWSPRGLVSRQPAPAVVPPLDGHTFECAKVALAMMTGVVTGPCDCKDRK